MTTAKEPGFGNIPKVSDAQKETARKEGVKEAVQEQAKDSYAYVQANNISTEGTEFKYLGMDDIQQYAGIIGFGLDEFKDRIAEDTDDALPENKVAGLLALERAGQNRTPYVKALMDRLGVKSPYEVTNAGPDYTNDLTAITKL